MPQLSSNTRIAIMIRVLLFFLVVLFTSVKSQCPHEDPALLAYSDPNTWPNQELPINGTTIYLDFPLLLDTTTERLGGIHIVDGGKLVFLDDPIIIPELITEYVLIEDGGEMWIGADTDECRFRGEADILLIGERDEAKDIGDWKQKFIGVDVGGALHIYGKFASPEMVKWTRLSATLNPKEKLFLSREHETDTRDKHGFLVYIFDAAGNLIAEGGDIFSACYMEAILENIIPGEGVVVIGKKKWGLSQRNFDDLGTMQDVIERHTGMELGSTSLANLDNAKDAWALAVSVSNTSNFQEGYAPWIDNEIVQTDLLVLEADGNVYNVFSASHGYEWRFRSEVYVEAHEWDYFNHILNLQDDVGSSWKEGDEIVVASTDYDHEQAEVFKILSVDGSTVTVEGDLLHQHYGDAYEGVEMYAEVGLLTRNIRIHGEMNATCYGNLCEAHDLDFDYFGGHTKAIEGFGVYTIQGAELYDMGQIGLGTYPIHFHMALDTERNGKKMEIKGNAIHHTYNRCTTIHGSHNVQVLDNVAFNNLGHCYFLEDGGEKNTRFEGNLGLCTRRGFVIPSDSQPSTFWITSPLTELLNNVAAGSDYHNGVGIWLLFPDEPVGPSRDHGFFADKEAKRTPISTFYNNVAHSNGNIGLAFFKRLTDNHGITGCSTYTPLIDPLDPKSSLSPIVLDTFTGYKNRRRNVVMRSTAADLVNFRLSDSQVSVMLVRNMLGGFQRLKDSIIIGESPNLGEGSSLSYRSEELGWQPLGFSERSYPTPSEPFEPVVGVYIQAEGPSHLENIRFFDFLRNENREAAAIYWHDDYRFHNGATTSAQGLDFNFEDPEDGLRMLEPGNVDGKGDTTVTMKDIDGSLTGSVGAVVTQTGVYFADGSDCAVNEDWNMQICEDEHFAKMYMFPNTHKEDLYNALTFHDLEADPTGNTFEEFASAGTLNMRMSYSLPAARTGHKGFYLLHWIGRMDEKFGWKMSALEQGEQLVLGYCLPQAANETAAERLVKLETGTPIVQATDLLDLMSGLTDANVYFDREKSIMFRRYYQETARDPSVDLSDCIGDITELKACQYFQVNVDRAELPEGVTIDPYDADCTGVFGGGR